MALPTGSGERRCDRSFALLHQAACRHLGSQTRPFCPFLRARQREIAKSLSGATQTRYKGCRTQNPAARKVGIIKVRNQREAREPLERLTLWLVGPEDKAFSQYIPENFRAMLGRDDTVCVGAAYGTSACGAALAQRE